MNGYDEYETSLIELKKHKQIIDDFRDRIEKYMKFKESEELDGKYAYWHVIRTKKISKEVIAVYVQRTFTSPLTGKALSVREIEFNVLLSDIESYEENISKTK